MALFMFVSFTNFFKKNDLLPSFSEINLFYLSTVHYSQVSWSQLIKYTYLCFKYQENEGNESQELKDLCETLHFEYSRGGPDPPELPLPPLDPPMSLLQVLLWYQGRIQDFRLGGGAYFLFRCLGPFLTFQTVVLSFNKYTISSQYISHQRSYFAAR